MVNWSDPATIMSQANAFGHLLWALLGIMTWEVVTTLGFDFRVIRNIREFKWPLSFYFVCRYSILLALIMLNFVNNVKSEINCQAAYTSVQFLGNVTIGATSNLLMFRSMAIWARNTWVVVPLVLIAMGHWAILLHGVIAVRAQWVAEVGVCVVTGTSTLFLRLLYGYTMAFDLLVLVLSIAGLTRTGHGRGSGLWKLLFRDGIAYFTVAFIGNLIAAIFAILHLNAAYVAIFRFLMDGHHVYRPAAVFSAIVACRASCGYPIGQPGVYIHSSARVSSRQTSSGKRTKQASQGVHISMDTYTNNNADITFYHGQTQSGTSTIDLERATNVQSIEEIHDTDKDQKYGATSFMPMH
ncbi:hypothetical protein RhiLY_03074 [Ceratobasidium sp. AG-Ba]|nr:hypothetical protein RhiLY_03074 [Ceratobasidium sp. AG-Ba]